LSLAEREGERLRRETSELSDTASSQALAREGLLRDLSEYKEHMHLVSAAKDELTRTCDSQAERIDGLTRALRQTELSQVEGHRTSENLKRKVAVLESELANKEDSVRSLSARLGSACEDVAKTSDALAAKKKELTDAMDDVRVLVDEVNKWKSAMGEADRLNQSAKRDLTEAKRRLETALQALRATEIERDDVLGLYRQSAAEIENRKFQIDVLDREKKQLHSAINDAVRAIEEARQTDSVLRGEVRARDLDVAALKERVQLLSVQLDQVLAEGDQGRRGVGRLMHEMKMQEEVQRVLEEQRVGFEREVARLEADVHGLVTNLKTTDARLEKKTLELDDAERRYNALAAYRAEAVQISPLTQGAGVQELLQTIEQQYRMIGELDSEVETLKTRLANNSAVFS
jgi:chromosome segregation ATPase